MAARNQLSDRGTTPLSVRIHTLGRFQVKKTDQPQDFQSRAHRKPLELLKVLIAQGAAQVAEEVLSDALWPDADGAQAHSNLASTLHRLRRLIGQDTVVLRNRRLTLNLRQCWVDAHEFADALKQADLRADVKDIEGAWAHLQRALTLYRGPFLEGEFEPPEILTARQRLHGQFLRHIREFGARFAESGDLRRAIVLYGRGLEIDPLAEGLYQALMRGYLELGLAAEGLAVYRRCHEQLGSGLGITPAPETELLAEQLLAVRRVSDKAPAGPAKPAMPEPARPADAASLHRRWWGWGAAVAVTVAAAVAIVAWREYAPGFSSPEADLTTAQWPTESSLAVLPFANLSGDPEQDYFSDAVTDELITQLSKLSGIVVIARSSSLRYRNRPVSIQQVASELNVRFVLEGTVQKSDNQLRLTAQLSNAQSGATVWAERYDTVLSHLFSVRDEITQRIALAVLKELEVDPGEGDLLRISSPRTPSMQAWELYARGRAEYFRFTRGHNRIARWYFQDALALDPTFEPAILGIGWTYYAEEWWWRSCPGGSVMARSDEDEDLYVKAQMQAEAAIALNKTLAGPYALLGRVYLAKKQHQQAVEFARQSVRMNPNSAEWLAYLANALHHSGKNEEAAKYISRARHLNPFPEELFLYFHGQILYRQQRYDEAITVLKQAKARIRTPHFERLCALMGPLNLYLLASLGAAGNPEAQGMAANYSMQYIKEVVATLLPFRMPADEQRLIADLAKAGVK